MSEKDAANNHKTNVKPMSKYKFSANVTLICLLLLPAVIQAQNLLNAPQKAVIDFKRNRLLISNYNSGDLIQIDSNGNQSEFVKNANFVDGLEIVGDTVYGIGNDRNIRAYDLNTKALVMDTTMPHVNPDDDYLSSITYDSAGHLFISCPGLNTIYRMRISDGACWVFASGSGLNRPNGILLERDKGRITVIDDSRNISLIHAISLSDSSVSTLCSTNLNSPDGIVRDKLGSYYIGGYYLSGIFKIDSAFSSPPKLFASGNSMVYPTYDPRDHSLLVTYYNSNGWGRIPLQVFNFMSDGQTGHAPLQVKFSQLCETLKPVTAWNWDFNNDGIVDSHDPNPIHIYQQPGSYTVSLQVFMDTVKSTITKTDYIQVFNGISAVKFIGGASHVNIPPSPALNLTGSFTIEFVVKPEIWGSNFNQSSLFDKSAVKIGIAGNILGAVGDSSLAVNLTLQNGTQVKLTAPNGCIKLNSCQHIAVSYNSQQNSLKMYINGIEQQVKVIGSNQPSGPLQGNDTIQTLLGNNSAFNSGLQGIIDELRIWNTIRTDSDIRNKMNHVLTGNETGLIGYWNMDEGNGPSILDKTFNGNNGILNSAFFTNGVDLSALTAIDDISGVELAETDFRLEQNFPNPFNPSTTIQYRLAAKAAVKIYLVNTLGETVAEFSEGVKNEGTHVFHLRAGALPSGVYCVDVQAGSSHRTIKVILLR